MDELIKRVCARAAVAEPAMRFFGGRMKDGRGWISNGIWCVWEPANLGKIYQAITIRTGLEPTGAPWMIKDDSEFDCDWRQIECPQDAVDGVADLVFGIERDGSEPAMPVRTHAPGSLFCESFISIAKVIGAEVAISKYTVPGGIDNFGNDRGPMPLGVFVIDGKPAGAVMQRTQWDKKTVRLQL